MSSSRNGKPSRRTIILSVAIGVVTATAVVAVGGFYVLTQPRDYAGSCREIVQDTRVGTSLQISFSERQCVVMVDPVPVDSEEHAPLVVTPDLLNEDEVFRALGKSIRGQSADTATDAVAIAHFLVDETGVVRQQRIAESSGYEDLDEAVLAIASLSSFSPAEDEEGPAEAWVALKVGYSAYQTGLGRLQQRLERWRREAEM